MTPVVALAGWFVDCRVKLPEVKLFNGKLIDESGQLDSVKLKKSLFFLPQSKGNQIDSEMIYRIVHQMDAKCRDVEPTAYNKGEK